MVKVEKFVLLGLLLFPLATWSQSSSTRPSNPDSKPTNNSLLARSEMQQPQPLPIVKPLRLQEIPAAERDKVRPGSITPYSSTDTDSKEVLDIEVGQKQQTAKGSNQNSSPDPEDNRTVYATQR